MCCVYDNHLIKMFCLVLPFNGTLLTSSAVSFNSWCQISDKMWYSTARTLLNVDRGPVPCCVSLYRDIGHVK